MQPTPDTPTAFADLRARVAAVQDRAVETTATGTTWPTITRLASAPVPPGWTMYRVGPPRPARAGLSR